jgi:uncharacterized protein (DUF1697 family)
MPRYVALLRGVSPMNARMPQLKRAFEDAGFTAVKTVLSSGNVVFDARRGAVAALERKCEAAMQATLGQAFVTFVRPVEHLQRLLDADPFAAFELPRGSKRVVTFLRTPPGEVPALPIALRDARILALQGTELLTSYVPGDTGPDFMRLIEKTFGRTLTTRTWETVRRCAAA